MANHNGEARTANPARVMRRLCKHWSHKHEVGGDEASGFIQLGEVRVDLRVLDEQRLAVALSHPQGEVPERLKGVVAEHLQRMAGGEPLEMSWS